MDYASSASPNPSSIHLQGVGAKNDLESARKMVADVFSARPDSVIFTSGGTESNNLAIQGIILGWWQKERKSGKKLNAKYLPHIVTTNIEHPSVLETVGMLKERGQAEVTILPVEVSGIVDPKKIRKAIKKNTVLVSVMYANNEIGTIEPIREIAKEIRHYRKENETEYPFFHTDAAQAPNYLELNTERLGVDMLTLTGAKIPEAGRVGVLYKRKSVLLAPVMAGGDQEFGLRAGTESIFEITKFAKALRRAESEREKESKRLLGIRDYLYKKIQKIVPEVIINGEMENRLPNNLNITIPHIPSDLLVIELSSRGIMISEKSACKSGEEKASHVIVAIREKEGKNSGDTGSLRFSLGRDTTKADIDYTLKALSEILIKHKKWYH